MGWDVKEQKNGWEGTKEGKEQGKEEGKEEGKEQRKGRNKGRDEKGRDKGRDTELHGGSFLSKRWYHVQLLDMEGHPLSPCNQNRNPERPIFLEE